MYSDNTLYKVLFISVQLNMYISNFRIENFRNIVRANVDFKRINIFTGKNSSGKSNFLLALSNALYSGSDFSSIFFDNVVTFGQGKSKCTFKTTVKDVRSRFIVSGKNGVSYFKPEALSFEMNFKKNNFSPTTRKLFYTGDYLKKHDYKVDFNKMVDPFGEIAKLPDIEPYDHRLVYEDNSAGETTHDKEGIEYIQKIQPNILEDADQFYDIFTDLHQSIFSFVDDRQLFSSAHIYKFVTERIENPEVYEQIISYLKESDSGKGRYRAIPLKKAKFINILADVQKNSAIHAEFNKDLKLYTDGLIDDLRISIDGSYVDKGQITVSSPNAPKNIFCISTGTAVLIYFILMKNWVRLNPNERTYERPFAMIFDEIDSVIHPSLMPQFTELLKSMSKYVQLFITSHSPHFIDCFEKDELFWLKDNISLSDKGNSSSVSSIYSFAEILKNVKTDKSHYFNEKTNSELFINGLLDFIFPFA